MTEEKVKLSDEECVELFRIGSGNHSVYSMIESSDVMSLKGIFEKCIIPYNTYIQCVIFAIIISKLDVIYYLVSLEIFNRDDIPNLSDVARRHNHRVLSNIILGL